MVFIINFCLLLTKKRVRFAKRTKPLTFTCSRSIYFIDIIIVYQCHPKVFIRCTHPLSKSLIGILLETVLMKLFFKKDDENICVHYFTRSPQPILDYSLLPRLRHLDYLFAFRRPQSPLQSVMDAGKDVVPGIGCLPVGLKGILASSGGDLRSRF